MFKIRFLMSILLAFMQGKLKLQNLFNSNMGDSIIEIKNQKVSSKIKILNKISNFSIQNACKASKFHKFYQAVITN